MTFLKSWRKSIKSNLIWIGICDPSAFFPWHSGLVSSSSIARETAENKYSSKWQMKRHIKLCCYKTIGPIHWLSAFVSNKFVSKSVAFCIPPEYLCLSLFFSFSFDWLTIIINLDRCTHDNCNHDGDDSEMIGQNYSLCHCNNLNLTDFHAVTRSYSKLSLRWQYNLLVNDSSTL